MADTPLVDPLRRTLTLHDHTWFGHICRGTQKCASVERSSKTAITNPNEIRFSEATRQIAGCISAKGLKPV